MITKSLERGGESVNHGERVNFQFPLTDSKVLPPDHLPPGIPMPNASALDRLHGGKGALMTESTGLRRGRNAHGDEVCFPVCRLEDGARVPFFTSITPQEFQARYGFDMPEPLIRRMHDYAQIAASITGGADNGLETARVLSAVTIFQRFRGSKVERQRLDGVLQSDFGLPQHPSKYADTLDQLEEAMAANDRGRRLLAFLQDYGVTPLEAARDISLRQPGILLTHLIQTITDVSLTPNMHTSPLAVRWYEDVLHNVMISNVGQLLWRNDFSHADIVNAIGWFKELVFRGKFPRSHTMGEDILRSLVPMYPPNRFSSRLLSTEFIKLLIEHGIADERSLDGGSIVTRANIKTVSSLLPKALLFGRKRLQRLADNLGVPIPQLTDSRAENEFQHTKMLEAVLDCLQHSGGSRVLGHARAVVRDAMMRQNDVVRARVDFADPTLLNIAVRRVGELHQEFGSLQRWILGDRLGGEMFAAWNTPDGATDVERKSLTNLGKAPSQWVRDWFLSLPVPAAAYVAAHTYMPLRCDGKSIRVGGTVGGEIQFSLQALRGPGNLRRLLFNREKMHLPGVTVPWDLVRHIQEQAKERL